LLYGVKILNETKTISKVLVENVVLYVAQTWALNTERANKLLATGTDVWRTARNSREEKLRYFIVRATVNIGKSILPVEVIDKKQMP
jgi:hypothetical protein